MMAERTIPEYAKMVRRIAEGNHDVSDYRELSEQMMDELAGNERELLARLLPGYMRAVLTRKPRGTDESVWDDFLNERLFTTGRGTIFVKDATVPEINAAAERRERLAGNVDKRGKQFRKVAHAMVETGSRTVSDVPAEMGVQALHDLHIQIAVEKNRRIKSEARARNLSAVEKALVTAESWIEQKATPTVLGLRKRRDEIRQAIRDERYSARRMQISHEVLQEMQGQQ